MKIKRKNVLRNVFFFASSPKTAVRCSTRPRHTLHACTVTPRAFPLIVEQLFNSPEVHLCVCILGLESFCVRMCAEGVALAHALNVSALSNTRCGRLVSACHRRIASEYCSSHLLLCSLFDRRSVSCWVSRLGLNYFCSQTPIWSILVGCRTSMLLGDEP